MKKNQAEKPLYQKLTNLDSNISSQIRKIISITAKNLIDLTTALISTHFEIINPEYSSLKIPEQLESDIQSWHEELLSNAKSSRRNIGRLVSDIKYMVGTIKGADQLFLSLHEIAHPINQNWSGKVDSEVYSNLKKIFVDVCLIVDPDTQSYNEKILSNKVKSIEEECQNYRFEVEGDEIEEEEEVEEEDNTNELTPKKFNFIQGKSIKEKEFVIQGEELSTSPGIKLQNGFIKNPSPLKNPKEVYVKRLTDKFTTLKESLLNNTPKGKDSEVVELDDESFNIKSKIMETLKNIQSVQSEEYNSEIPSNVISRRQSKAEISTAKTSTKFSPIKKNPFLLKNSTMRKSIEKQSNPKFIFEKTEDEKESIIIQEVDKENHYNINNMKKSKDNSIKALKSSLKNSRKSPNISKGGKIKKLRVEVNKGNEFNSGIETDYKLEIENNNSEKTLESQLTKQSLDTINAYTDQSIISGVNTHHLSLGNSDFGVPDDDFKSLKSSNKKVRIGKSRNSESNNSLCDHKKSFNFSNQTFNASRIGSECSLLNKKHDIRFFEKSNPSFGFFKEKSKFLKNEVNNESHIEGDEEYDIEEELEETERDIYKEERANDLSIIKEGGESTINNSLEFDNFNTSDDCLFKRKIQRNSVSSRESISPNQTLRQGNNVMNVNEFSMLKNENEDSLASFEQTQNNSNTSYHIFARTSAPQSEIYDSGQDIRMNIFKTQSSFDIDKFMQNRNSEVIHTNLYEIDKIEVSKDGSYAFFGGVGLNVLDMTKGEYKMIRKDKEKSK